MFMYEILWFFGLICLGCWAVWAGAMLYSLFFNKGKTRWLRPTLIVLGLVGFAPLPIYMVWYTIDYYAGHPTVSRVSGSYRGSFAGEADTLTLLPNGTFTQRFAAPNGQAYTSTGRWTLSPAGFSIFDFDSSDTVTLDKVMVHLTGSGKQQKPRFSLSGERWRVDHSSLCYSQDEDSEGTCFTR